MPRKKDKFRLIDPLNPPSPDGEFGRLASIIVESTIWFCSDPIDRSPGVIRSGELPTISEIDEAIEAAQGLLAAGQLVGVAAKVTAARMAQEHAGWALVNLFCDRFIAKQPAYQVTLSTGRKIGQRQLLCAFALLFAERTALAIRAEKPRDVSNLMWNLLELICEIRRSLDREAGSTVAARRARQRWEKMYELRAGACRLFDEKQWRSTRQAAQKICPKVNELAEAIGAPKLSSDRGFQTVYEWLLAHKKSTSA